MVSIFYHKGIEDSHNILKLYFIMEIGEHLGEYNQNSNAYTLLYVLENLVILLVQVLNNSPIMNYLCIGLPY